MALSQVLRSACRVNGKIKSKPKRSDKCYIINFVSSSRTVVRNQIPHFFSFEKNCCSSIKLEKFVVRCKYSVGDVFCCALTSISDFQEIKRTISTTPVKNSSAGGSHAALWTIERGVSLGLLAVIPGAFLFPCQALDALMAVSVVMHQHW